MKKSIKKAISLISAISIAFAGFTAQFQSQSLLRDSYVSAAENNSIWVTYTDSNNIDWEFTTSKQTSSTYTNAELELTDMYYNKGAVIPDNLIIPSTFNFTTKESASSNSRQITFKNAKLTTITSARIRSPKLTIPATVRKLGFRAFVYQKNVKQVVFASNSQLTEIGEQAFLGCKSLTVFTIPNSVKSIAANAFCDCVSLPSITIPKSITSIGGGAFENCILLKNVVIPNTITNLGSDMFYGCNALESISYNTNMEYPGLVVKGCNALKTINNQSIFINNDINPAFQKFFVPYSFGDFKPLDDIMVKKINQIASDVTKGCSDDFIKLAKIQKWIHENVYYSYGGKDKSGPECHSDYSVFLNDYTVCEGYSRAFALLAQAAGIETYLVYGESNSTGVEDHAWNIVKLGNTYYELDCTMDDKSRLVYQSFYYFLEPHKFVHPLYNTSIIKYPNELYNKYNSPNSIKCNSKLGDADGDQVYTKMDLSILSDYVNKEISDNDLRFMNWNIDVMDLNFDGRITDADVKIFSDFLNDYLSNSSKYYGLIDFYLLTVRYHMF